MLARLCRGNPHGLKTDYLWKQVLQKDSLDNIIENFTQVVEEEDEKGKKRRKQVFPRFHQLRTVRALLRRSLEDGVGKRYLIQHSAGILPLIILIGLRFGVFTPTEAAVVAAVYALFVATVVYREIKPSQFYALFVSAAKTSAIVMFLVAAAMVSAWMITVADLPSLLVEVLEPLIASPMLLMVFIMALVIAVGTAMDMTPTILILTPVLMPIITKAGIDPIYFGVLFIINNSIGLITPPVGVVLNVVAGVGRMKMDELTRGALPFAAAEYAMMFLMVLFPQLIIWPLKLMGG